MTYTNLVLEKSNLLAFLAKPTNRFTEHYVSSQPLCLYIPYSEYIKVIKDVISSNLNILRHDLSVYKSCLSRGEDSAQMHRLFSYDVACAGLYEIKKSHTKGLPCTRIFGIMDCETNVEVKSISLESSADFVIKNFSQDELKELYNFIYNEFGIPISIIRTKDETLISNAYMFLSCVANLGVYKFRNDFILSTKEE